jgi:hypothetical protein
VTARRLVPKKPAPPQTPQCQAVVDTEGFYTHALARRANRMKALGWDQEKCTRGSTIEIDGTTYCAQHAGAVAIEILTGERRTKKISTQDTGPCSGSG